MYLSKKMSDMGPWDIVRGAGTCLPRRKSDNRQPEDRMDVVLGRAMSFEDGGHLHVVNEDTQPELRHV
jgi:hypothetical protein